MDAPKQRKPPRKHFYVWRAFYSANGKAVDLNSLLVDPPEGLVLRDVFYISNTVQILAGARYNENSYSPTYLLTPVETAAKK